METDHILKVIQKRRKSLKISIQEMAHLLSIEDGTYLKIESGEIDITLKELLKVSKFIQLDINKVISEATENIKKKPSFNISDKIMKMKQQGILDVYEAEEISDIKKKVDQIWELLNHKEKNNLVLDKEMIDFAHRN